MMQAAFGRYQDLSFGQQQQPKKGKMSHIEDRVRETIKTLRSRLGGEGKPLSQTEMAARIGKTLITVQRYESTGVIPTDALGAYCRVAMENDYNDIAESLRQILIEQIGEDAMNAILWEPATRRKVLKIANGVPETLRPTVEELLDLLQNPQTDAEIHEVRFLMSRLEERRKRRKGNGTR